MSHCYILFIHLVYTSLHRIAWQENIRANLSRLLKAHISVVNIKAKTHEKVRKVPSDMKTGCVMAGLLCGGRAGYEAHECASVTNVERVAA